MFSIEILYLFKKMYFVPKIQFPELSRVFKYTQLNFDHKHWTTGNNNNLKYKLFNIVRNGSCLISYTHVFLNFKLIHEVCK